jgi:hypothetical protein
MPYLSSFSRDTNSSKIKCAFNCFARYTVGIHHRRSYIGMVEHRLDRANILICLQKMCSKPGGETHKVRGPGLEK